MTDYPLGPALDTLRRLWRLDHALAQLSRRMERTLGVTGQQRLIVRCIGKYPGINAGQLAGLLHLDPGTVSAALRRLEARALVERRRDPKDKRRVALGLTAAGHALDQPRLGTVEHAVEALLAELSPREATRFVALIDRFAELVESDLRAGAVDDTSPG